MYLTEIKDVFGRTAGLNYGDKLWDGSTPSAPREYSDPHRATPGTTPGPYQDRYETKYLASVAISAPDGSPLLTLDLGYAPTPTVQGPEQAVANVTSTSGSLYGDTFKRYLTSITIQNPLGDALPGYLYEYHLDPAAAGAQPGALKVLTSPKGGRASYTYASNQLPICNRKQKVERPAQAPSGSPRVFYGDDYVVTVWFDPQASVVALQVWTWCGRWICWQLNPTDPTLDTGNFDDTSVNVLANSQFFVLSFNRADGSDAVAYVFNKQIAKSGQFAPAVLAPTTTGVNSPTLSLPITSGTATFVAGSSFFAVAQMNLEASSNPWNYYILTYRWTTQAWDQQLVSPANYTYLAANDEYLLAIDSNGAVSLSYLDGALEWQTAAPASAPVSIGTLNTDPTQVGIASGPGFAAVNLLSAEGPSCAAIC